MRKERSNQLVGVNGENLSGFNFAIYEEQWDNDNYPIIPGAINEFYVSKLAIGQLYRERNGFTAMVMASTFRSEVNPKKPHLQVITFYMAPGITRIATNDGNVRLLIMSQQPNTRVGF